MRDLKYIAILIAISGFLFFFKLGDMALTDPDETFYAQTSREMLEAKEWAVPLIFGKPQFEKPPMYYWLIRSSYMALGVNEFAARLPSAVFGLIGVIGVYFLARMLFSPKCGFLSGIITATGAQYVVLSRGCVTDMVLTVFILLCITFFVKGWMTPGSRASYLISAAMAALAVLTKGPIGLFLPAVILGSYLLASGGWRGLGRIPWLWCAAVFAVIAVPWYVVVSVNHGEAFLSEFIGLHNIIRFIKPEHRIGDSPFFYFPVVVGGFAPWSVFLPFAVWEMYKRGKEAASPLKGYRFLLLAWFLAVFLFFTASRTKLVTYIFPLFPALSIVTGWFWERAISEKERGASTDRQLFGAFLMLALAGAGGLIGAYFALKSRYSALFPGISLAFLFLAAGIVLAIVALLKGRRSGAFAALSGGMIAGALPLVFLVTPLIGELESVRPLCRTYLKLAEPGQPIGGECDNRRGIAFYTGKTDVTDIHPTQALSDFIARDERVWCIMREKHLARLKEGDTYIVPPPVAKSGKNVLITNKPLEKGQGAGVRGQGVE